MKHIQPASYGRLIAVSNLHSLQVLTSVRHAVCIYMFQFISQLVILQAESLNRALQIYRIRYSSPDRYQIIRNIIQTYTSSTKKNHLLQFLIHSSTHLNATCGRSTLLYTTSTPHSAQQSSLILTT